MSCVSFGVFRKVISCLKKSFKATIAPIQRPGAEVRIWEG